jgi:hypothetical protein
VTFITNAEPRAGTSYLADRKVVALFYRDRNSKGGVEKDRHITALLIEHNYKCKSNKKYIRNTGRETS